MWALVVDARIVAAAMDDLGEPGWLRVVPTPRPEDTTSTTWDKALALVDGLPTVTWSERAKTADELAEESDELRAALVDATERRAARQAALGAVQRNVDYLALSPPTAAQVAAQVAALTRQANALIRLSIN